MHIKTFLLLTTIIILTGAGTSALAQQQQEVPSNKSIKGGLVFSNFNNTDLETSAAPGFVVGLSVDFLFSERFSVMTEALYAEKGSNVSDPSVDTDFDLTMDYIEIPILAKYRIASSSWGTARPYLFAGPYLAFLLVNNSSTEVMNDQQYTPDDLVQDAKTTDWGAVVGIGTELDFTFNTMSAELRYSAGISSAFGGQAPDGIRNGALAILIGFRF